MKWPLIRIRLGAASQTVIKNGRETLQTEQEIIKAGHELILAKQEALSEEVGALAGQFADIERNGAERSADILGRLDRFMAQIKSEREAARLETLKSEQAVRLEIEKVEAHGREWLQGLSRQQQETVAALHRLEETLLQQGAEIAGSLDGVVSAVGYVLGTGEVTLLLAGNGQGSSGETLRAITHDAVDALPLCHVTQVIVDDRNLGNGWGAWGANQNAHLGSGGSVSIDQDTSTPGIRLNRVAVPSAALCEVEFVIDADDRQRLFVWAIDSESDALLCHIPLPAQGPVQARFWTWAKTTKIDIGLLVSGPRKGEVWDVASVTLRCLDPAGLRTGLPPVVASLASMPERVQLLRDTVASLLPQVDRVRVFLNGYSEVPAFLNHARIEVRRSQDWDDRGDASKFAWASEDAEANVGYVAISDDDIVYPPDYIARMVKTLQRYGNRAVVGLHGVIVRQPFTNYYDPADRTVFHFRAALAEDQPVHVLGTNAVMYHTEQLALTAEMFCHRNMGDIWIALAAQRQNIPMVAVARHREWVQEGRLPAGEVVPTIYAASVKGTGTLLDTAAIQTAVLRRGGPVSVRIPPEMAIAGRRKLILAIKTFNRKDYLRHCLDSFEKTADRRHSWVVVIADDGSTDGTREMLKTLRIPFELHVIYNDRRFAVGQTNTLFDLASRLGFDVGFAIDDDVIFRKPGWEQLYLQAIEASGYAHLCHLNLPHWRELRAKQKPGQAEPKAMTDQSGTCEARVSVNECMGCLYTFTPEVLRVVGGCDEANFPIRGQWHQDWSARAARAGFNVVNTFFDAREASDYIDLQNNVDETYRAAIPWGPEYAKTRDAGELARRRALVRDASRCFVPIPRPTPSVKGDNVNDVFERIVMLNLDRRPDRLEIMTRRLERTGIRWERFAAIDGQNPECGAAYEAYLAGQPWQQIADEMALPRNSLAFYRENFSEVVRARFIAKRSRQAPIATAGAWGYLRSMERILSDALRDGIDSLLVFDDDCRFHRDFKALFAAGMAEVPTDWVILQLGALQHDWGTSWTETFSSHLYRCRGTSVGSHATGMKAEAFPVLLEHCHRNQLPYDLGALNVAKRLFADTSLTFLPNLAIQDDSRSDIGSSVLPLCNRNKEGNVFGWTIADYEDAGRGSAQHDGRS